MIGRDYRNTFIWEDGVCPEHTVVLLIADKYVFVFHLFLLNCYWRVVLNYFSSICLLVRASFQVASVGTMIRLSLVGQFDNDQESSK